MTHLLRAATAAIVVALASAAPAAAQPAAPAAAQPSVPNADAVPGELLVRFEPGVPGEVRADVRAAAGTRAVRALHRPGLQLLRVQQDTTVATAIRELEADPRVRYAEPNHIYRRAAVPNDTRFSQLWGMNNAGQSVNGISGTADADIDAPEAWDVATGDTNTLVAVVDTGVAYDHPDLAANMWVNNDPAGGGDQDGNGFPDDVRGWDFVDDDNDPRDFEDHGTHVAGTIAGTGNNGQGVTGVNWAADIMAVRVLGFGGGSNDDVAAGFDYAGDNGAKIVNASLGGPGVSQAIEDAVTDHPNTLYVVAAGNDANNNDGATASYPCNITAANLICVAATTQSDGLAGFSNFGSTSVDLGAPGTNVVSTLPDIVTAFTDGFEVDDFGTKWVAQAPWARTNEIADSGTFSMTDSPEGSYANDLDASVRTASSINLSGRLGCHADYDMRLATESGFDFLRIETATAAGGPYTQRVAWHGSTGGDFDPFSTGLGSDGQSIFLRFRLDTDASTVSDGAHFDDIAVECVTTTYDASDFAFFQGTSMATPHVAGAAALLLDVDPTATVAELRSALLTTGDPKPALTATTVTGRRLNLRAAVEALAPPAPDAPAATTNPATGVTSVDAMLNGTVNPNGQATTYRFQFGTTTAYGRQTADVPVGAGGSAVAVTAGIAGLAPSTTYNFRLVATNAGGTTNGANRTFTTPASGGGTPGPQGPTGPTGPTGQDGRDAEVTCRVRPRGKVSRRVRCVVRAVPAVRRATVRLVRRGRVVARGAGRVRAGRLPLRTVRRPRAGHYRLTLTLVHRDGERTRVRTRIRLR